MKINHGYQDSRSTSAQDVAKTQETAAAQARIAKAGAVSKSGSSDEVSLSSLASALQDALTDSPERSAHLDRLAGEFAAGTYKPDAKATVSGIIADSLAESPDPDK